MVDAIKRADTIRTKNLVFSGMKTSGPGVRSMREIAVEVQAFLALVDSYEKADSTSEQGQVWEALEASRERLRVSCADLKLADASYSVPFREIFEKRG